jgi:hypothetical protein
MNFEVLLHEKRDDSLVTMRAPNLKVLPVETTTELRQER